MSTDNFQLEQRIAELERELKGFGNENKIEALEYKLQDLERKIDSNNSNDSDYKIQNLENKIYDLERKIDSNNFSFQIL